MNDRRWTLLYGLLLLGAGLFLWVGYLLGVQRTNDQLPQCQEDEVLFPKDYKGPGQHVASDYRCIHIDNILNGKDWHHDPVDVEVWQDSGKSYIQATDAEGNVVYGPVETNETTEYTTDTMHQHAGIS